MIRRQSATRASANGCLHKALCPPPLTTSRWATSHKISSIPKAQTKKFQASNSRASISTATTPASVRPTPLVRLTMPRIPPANPSPLRTTKSPWIPSISTCHPHAWRPWTARSFPTSTWRQAKIRNCPTPPSPPPTACRRTSGTLRTNRPRTIRFHPWISTNLRKSSPKKSTSTNRRKSLPPSKSKNPSPRMPTTTRPNAAILSKAPTPCLPTTGETKPSRASLTLNSKILPHGARRSSPKFRPPRLRKTKIQESVKNHSSFSSITSSRWNARKNATKPSEHA